MAQEMFASESFVRGVVDIVLRDKKGRVKKQLRAVANLVVDNGKYGIADQLLATPSIAKPSHMAIGTGTTTPVVGDTALQAEVGTRVAFSSKTRSNNVVTMIGSFGAGNGTGAITEAGILNASSGGSLYSRVTFAAINKGANDTLELTWTYTIG